MALKLSMVFVLRRIPLHVKVPDEKKNISSGQYSNIININY